MGSVHHTDLFMEDQDTEKIQVRTEEMREAELESSKLNITTYNYHKNQVEWIILSSSGDKEKMRV